MFVLHVSVHGRVAEVRALTNLALIVSSLLLSSRTSLVLVLLIHYSPRVLILGFQFKHSFLTIKSYVAL